MTRFIKQVTVKSWFGLNRFDFSINTENETIDVDRKRGVCNQEDVCSRSAQV